MIKLIRFTFIFLIVAILITGCSSGVSTNNFTSVEVIKVTDGDTIKVDLHGQEENVRFLLVDTPEMNEKGGPQPFAVEAKAFVADLVDGRSVELEIGLSERDKYGRLLAYVYVDSQNIQSLLLERGLARVAYIYPPNTKYVDDYRDIQKKAQQKAVGIWSIENYATDDGFESHSVVNDGKEGKKTSSSREEISSDCKIKGNINSKGEKIYHMPDGQYYEQTHAEQWFCSEKDAQAAGFRVSSR